MATDTTSDAIVRRFVTGGRLAAIPARRAKRLAVLDWLAQAFEPGRIYPEATVNQVLWRFHPDHAALRRYLVTRDSWIAETGVTGAAEERSMWTSADEHQPCQDRRLP